jgi:hypothetical protein
MKTLVLTIVLSFLFFSNVNSTEKEQNFKNIETTKAFNFSPCTVTIKGNFEGIEVDLEITVDATWIECAFLKKGIKDAIKKVVKE